jgi:hypothetical protein
LTTAPEEKETLKSGSGKGGNLREFIVVWCVALMLSGCGAAVASDGGTPSTEGQESFATCLYLRTQEASCDERKKVYDEGFRAGKEIIAVEDRIEPTVCLETPLISDVDMPARMVNGVMIPAHRETGDCAARSPGKDGKHPRK